MKIGEFGEIVSGEQVQTWTKEYVLRKWNSTACAHEIQQHGDTEYMIMKWKSGDYLWGTRIRIIMFV